ncbi:MAG: hypothetical protein AAF990_00730 [Bacteroidota bacterium]
MKSKQKLSQQLLLLVVPQIELLADHLSAVEQMLIDEPKGFAIEGLHTVYHSVLPTNAEPNKRLSFIICSESHFLDSSFHNYLWELLPYKEAVYLCLHKNYKGSAMREFSLFELAGEKICFPILETDLTETDPMSKLLASCSINYLEGRIKVFKAELTSYFNRFKFNLSLEAALQLAHYYANGEKWLLEPSEGEYYNKLDRRMSEILSNPKIEEALRLYPPSLTQGADNQVFKFYKYLFDSQLLGTFNQ